MVTRHAALLDQVDQFDAALFGIPPREAVAMDPQHRLVLEVAWEALEDAGVAPDRLRSTLGGIFVGATSTDYAHLAISTGSPAAIDAYSASGNALNFISGRVAYLLGLVGPAMVVDTACSSSLVAVHLACESLRSGEVDIALAGGVNILLSPDTSIALSKARMLSPSGRCHTFDASADGYVRGEGIGVLVLRRLSDAVEMRDDVWAVLRGSAVNQDGRSSGLTVPYGPSQEKVIRTALKRAGIDPAHVGYVEAHGTGTPLGDPIELQALSRALASPHRGEALTVGSLKTNIGHLEAAAGIAGLIKSILAVHHGWIPPHLHFRTPNPHFDWVGANLSVPTTGAEFPAMDGIRTAGVSSFGVSGTNAHVVVGSAPSPSVAVAEGEPGPVVVKVSGQSASARSALAVRLADAVAHLPDNALGSVAWAANVGRSDLDVRGLVVATDRCGLVDGLHALAAGATGPEVQLSDSRPKTRGRVVFVVPGQGAQAAGALEGLYGLEPIITAAVDSLSSVMGTVDKPPLGALLRHGPESSEALTRTEVAQPALYALAVVLGRWWQAAGVEPDVVLGHSVGAYAAATLSGVFTDTAGAELVVQRGRLMGSLPAGGAMMAVRAGAAEVSEHLGTGVALAAINGPQQTVLSGRVDHLEAVAESLRARGVTVAWLEVSHAFHSEQVEPILPALAEVVERAKPVLPTRELVSDMTGEMAGEAVISSGYWSSHARQPTRFADALQSIAAGGIPEALVELGANNTLLSLARPQLGQGPLYVASLSPRRSPLFSLRQAAGQLWLRGIPIEWPVVQATDRPARRRLPLPTYPFQRRRYWLPDGSAPAAGPPRRADGPRIVPIDLPSPPPWTRSVTAVGDHIGDLLGEHVVHGHRVAPGVVHIELMLRAFERSCGQSPTHLRQLKLLGPLLVAPGAECSLHCTVTDSGDGTSEGRTDSLNRSGEWTAHATMLFAGAPHPAPTDSPAPQAVDLDAIRSRCSHHFEHDRFYTERWHPQFELGSSFRLVMESWHNGREVLGRVARARADSAVVQAGIRPGLLALDAAVQLLLASGPPETPITASDQLSIGTGFEAFDLNCSEDSDDLWCWAQVREQDGRNVTGDVLVVDDGGALIAALRGVSFRRVAPATLARLAGVGSTPEDGPAAPARTLDPAGFQATLCALDAEGRRQTILRYLVARMAFVLGTTADEVPPGKAVVELADSLMLAELKAHCEKELGIDIPVDVLFDTEDLEQLAGWLARQPGLGGEIGASPLNGSARGAKDLMPLARLDPSIAARGRPPELGRSGPAHVLLTGATGFVGVHILERLLSDTDATVHCLVRASSEREAEQRLNASIQRYRLGDAAGDPLRRRIRPVLGDLTEPGLGMRTATRRALASKVQAVYHSGAVVNWVAPYSALEAANVIGTAETLRFATEAGPIPFHFISTVGVFSSPEYQGRILDEEEPFDSAGPMAVGYAQTKWVAERMVRTAAERGLPTTIHRPNVGSSFRTGAFNPKDHLWLTLRACVELASVPDLFVPYQHMPVDEVARAVVAVSLRPAMAGRTFHLVNPERGSWADVFEQARRIGYRLDPQPIGAWVDALKSSVIDQKSSALAGLLPFFTDYMKESSLAVFDCGRSVADLADCGVDILSYGPDALARAVNSLVESGFLPPPKVAGGTR